MIEIIQETEKTAEKVESKLPKNIRQIGNPEKDFRIYMEDYVYTYLHPAQIRGMELGIFPRLLILVGEINHFSNRSCAFISGAIQVENGPLSEEVPELNEAVWRDIQKEMQQYFDKCAIVGWVLDIPGNTLAITEEMEQIHRKNFGDKNQFFFLMDSKEREEAFFTWKKGKLTKKEGYFIYYEKNPQMQEYMISRREAKYGDMPPLEEVKDQAARNYRAVMQEKKEHKYKRRMSFLSYLTSMLMVVVLCSVSVVLLKSIRRMEDMQQTLSVMSVAIDSTEQENQANQVAVETISGNVLPVDGTAQDQGAEASTGTVEENPNAAAPAAEDASSAETAQSTENAAQSGTAQGTDNGTQTDTSEATGNTTQTTENSTGDTTASTETAPSATEQPVQQTTMTEAEIYRAQGYYIVQAGDSLERICYKVYETYAMLDKLCEVNGIDNKDTIYIGQKLVLP